MSKEIVIIDNLKCGGCVNTVTKKMSAVEGVLNVKVDLETSTVEIEKEDAITRAFLLEKLGKLGYPEQGTSSFSQKAKSYVSCAVGRLDK
ncbi:MAG TPA: heavy-metal-associated domain-containing protein [Phaeodactylibacter sp.]|nr:heavy-metal-associated domain-containing protein [Phaeodactylibacter sp.]